MVWLERNLGIVGMNIKEKVKYVGMKNMWKQKQGQGKREEVAFLPFGSEQKKERFFFLNLIESILMKFHSRLKITEKFILLPSSLYKR